jgi:hypothetical protein
MDKRRPCSVQQPSESREPETAFPNWRSEKIEATCRVLAREGNYREADHRLRDWIRRYGATAPLMDLLARIAAQQGKLDEAKHLWQTAANLDPANAVYRVGLRKLNAVEGLEGRRSFVPSPAAVIIVALCAIIVALVLFIGYSQLHRHHRPKAPKAIATAHTLA